jgi:hypothetical protein
MPEQLENVDRPYEGVYGGRLATSSGDGRTHVLLAADAPTVAWAKEYFEEIPEDAIIWAPPAGKRKVRVRETGEVLRIMLGIPVGRERTSNIVGYCVRDGRLVLLQRLGDQQPEKLVYHGAVTGRKLGANDARGAVK